MKLLTVEQFTNESKISEGKIDFQQADFEKLTSYTIEPYFYWTKNGNKYDVYSNSTDKKVGVWDGKTLNTKDKELLSWLKGNSYLSEEKSPLQKEYSEFFNSVLNKFGVESPAELDNEKKKEFFNYIEKNWTKDETNEGKDIHTTRVRLNRIAKNITGMNYSKGMDDKQKEKVHAEYKKMFGEDPEIGKIREKHVKDTLKTVDTWKQ